MATITEGVVQSPSNGKAPAQNPSRAMGAHAACRFYVEIENAGGSPIQAVFTEVSGLQVEMQVTEYEEGGTNTFIHRLPGRLKVSNVTLKHGLTRSNDFLKWVLAPKIQRRNITVVMYDVAGKSVIRWDFAGAFPVKWVGPQFTADSTAMAIESIEIAHRGLSVDSQT
jgi:phage tail-like protein